MNKDQKASLAARRPVPPLRETEFDLCSDQGEVIMTARAIVTPGEEWGVAKAFTTLFPDVYRVNFRAPTGHGDYFPAKLGEPFGSEDLEPGLFDETH